MKKAFCLLLVCLTVVLTSSCNVAFKNQENFGPTVEFCTDYFYEGISYLKNDYICIYNKDNNKIVEFNNMPTSIGSEKTFHCDSSNFDKVAEYKNTNNLGQLNDYFCFGDTEYYLYWSFSTDSMNSLVTVKNGEINRYSLYKGAAVFYYHHTEEEIFFTFGKPWDRSKQELYMPIFVFNRKTGNVKQILYPLYNQQIENEFNVKASLDLPFAKRAFVVDKYRSEMVLTNDTIVSFASFETYIEDDGGIELSYWLQKRNTKTGEVEKMRVFNSENAVEIYETESGNYAVVSFKPNKEEQNFVCGVNKLYITEFDSNLNEINRIELDSSAFKNTSFFYASKYQNELFFVAAMPRGQKTVVSVYNIDTKTMTHSKNFIKGTEDGYCIVEKIDGKIHHLKMN